MKKITLFLMALMLITVSVSAQTKKAESVKPDVQSEEVVKDTTIAIQLPIAQFRGLLGAIDQLVDSKKASKDLIEFLQKSAQIVPEKPKDISPKGKQ